MVQKFLFDTWIPTLGRKIFDGCSIPLGAMNHEWVILELKQGIDRCNEGRPATKIVLQCYWVLMLTLGSKIGEDIRASKPIDRLFGVSDHHKRAAGQIRIENTLENIELDRIRILKLIDESIWRFCTKSFCKFRSSTVSTKCLLHAHEQILKGDMIASRQ